jgi:hypothetical protein
MDQSSDNRIASQSRDTRLESENTRPSSRVYRGSRLNTGKGKDYMGNVE